MERALASDLDAMLDSARDDLLALGGARVLVTGASGFVGSWLIEALTWADERLSLGLRVVALCRDPSRLPTHLSVHPGVQSITADVRSLSVAQLSGSVDVVVHAATPASAALNSSRPLEMIDTIVEGTRRVLDVAGSAGAGPLLFTSSGAVYGRIPFDIDAAGPGVASAGVSEDHLGGPDPLDAGSAYHEAKRLAELLCAITARDNGGGRAGSGVQPGVGVQPKVARLFAFVGPYLPIEAHFAVGNFIRDRLAGRAIVVMGDGTAVRSYLYASDMVVWLLAVLMRGAVGRAYNVGSERAVDIATLAQLVARTPVRAAAAPDGPSPVEIRGNAAPGASIDRYVPSTERIRRDLGVRESVQLEDGLERTIGWHTGGWRAPR